MDFQMNMAIQAQAAMESTITRLMARVAELENEVDGLQQEVAVLEAVLERASFRAPKKIIDLDTLSPEEREATLARLAKSGFTLDMQRGLLGDGDLDAGC